MFDLFDAAWGRLFSASMVASEPLEDDEVGCEEEEAWSLTPVRRNLL